MPIIRTCPQCGKSFRTKPSVIAGGRGLYCSIPCARKNKPFYGVERPCETCGKPVYARPAQIAAGRARFCSRTCSRQAQDGDWRIRFLSFVQIGAEANDCWRWTGTKSRTGYGMLRFNGMMDRAHRVSYQFHYGIEPGRMVVAHRCDNRECTNPRHLFLATQTENIRDMDAKGRRVPPPSGERNVNARLTNDQVRDIRRRLAAGETQAALNREYGVSKGTVSRIARGVSYPHIN